MPIHKKQNTKARGQTLDFRANSTYRTYKYCG